MRKEIKGMLTGLGVTFRTMTKPTVTVQYPHEREDPTPRARGVIALKEENCTVCMLCARSCPDWCIYIEGHKEKRPPRREGGRDRTVSVLDRPNLVVTLRPGSHGTWSRLQVERPLHDPAIYRRALTTTADGIALDGLAAVAGPGSRMQPGRAEHCRPHHWPHRPLRSMRNALPLP